MDKKSVIIIQGPVRLNPSFLEEKWLGFDLIWSTWDNENITTNNHVIYNKIPKNAGPSNLYLQQKSTISGLLKAKELEYETCLKWRSDQYPTNPNKLFSLFNNNKINVMFWHNYKIGYYVDYFMYGNIDEMINIWNFNFDDSVNFPEEKITNQLLSHNSKINCIGNQLDNENNIFWEKNNNLVDLSTYKNDKLFVIK